MAKLRGLAPKRRRCVAAINQAHGKKIITATSGHVAIAEQLVNLGYAFWAGEIGKKTAAKLIVGFCETDFGRTITPEPKPAKPTKSKSDNFLRSWEWTELRYRVMQKYGRKCMCCGASPSDGKTVINVDHIKPRHTHPELKLDFENLQVLCHECNKGKGAWDTTDFRS